MAWFSSHSIDLESGSRQYLSITDNASLSITGNITISAWVRFESLPAPANGMTIVSKFADTSDEKSYLFTLIAYAGPVYRIALLTSSDGNNQETLEKQYAFTTNTWYHVAVKWTASTFTAEFFVDGTSLGTATGGGSITAIYNSTAPFAIGTWFYSGAGGDLSFECFDGLIDDVRIWSRALSNTEIGNIYSNPVLFDNGANLQGWWKLDNSALDETANDNDLTATGSPVYSTTIPLHRCDVADTAGTPADSMSFKFYISKSEVAGSPTEASKLFSGWGSQSKTTASWTAQDKSSTP